MSQLDPSTKHPEVAPTLRELLPRYLPQLENYVRRNLSRVLRDHESASDLVGSVCGDLLADGIRFEYRSEALFLGWLRTVVVNKIRERLRFWRVPKRGHAVRVQATDSQVEAAQVDFASPSQEAVLREDLGLLEQALARLKDHHREIIVRTRLRGESHERVARDLGRTVAATRNLLTRALVKLAGELDRLQNGQ